MSDQRFCIIPARAIEIDYLGTNDLRVLCYVGKHADKHGWWRLSQVQMAKALGVSRGTIFNCVTRLADAQLLEKHEVDTASGRDSAHFYRVIYDIGLPEESVPAEVLETRRKRAQTTPENSPSDPCQLTGTPANKMAPPANPELAPPASPGLAPSITEHFNDPLSLSGAGAPEEGEREPVDVDLDRKAHEASERMFWKLVKAHPDTSGMPKERWKAEWFKLSPDDQRRAAERHSAWLDVLRKQKRDHIPALSTYFAEKLFADIDPPAAPIEPEGLPMPTCGKLWMAHRLWQCAFGKQGEWKATTAFAIAQFEKHPELFAVDIDTAKWAHVRRLPLRLMDETQVICGPSGDWRDFVQVKVGSAEFNAWQDWHRERGWPIMEIHGRVEWVWVPCADVNLFSLTPDADASAARARSDRPDGSSPSNGHSPAGFETENPEAAQ